MNATEAAADATPRKSAHQPMTNSYSRMYRDSMQELEHDTDSPISQLAPKSPRGQRQRQNKAMEEQVDFQKKNSLMRSGRVDVLAGDGLSAQRDENAGLFVSESSFSGGRCIKA
eukprot:TRINITY_DN22859_c0_g5_i1.p1 TRINITY_DN22859_c0_g5~~TRINITY_DN22859_c0_g5_i1.p1  ORF type:complete len:114 (+),score=15.75 TRINITY_DN22859_c0_g5_i1:258-599(+)